MIRDPQVTQVYARALFQAARKTGVTAVLQEQIRGILGLTAQDPRVRIFFLGLHIPTQAKINVAEKIFRPVFQPLLTDFILYLIRKGRIDYFRDILERFQTLAEADQGIFPARVTTPRELSSDEKERLQSSLERFSGRRLKIAYEINPTLIGGVVFALEDTYIDDSLRGHLKKLREQLQATVVY